MATQSLVDASQHHWDDTLQRLLTLSTTTLNRQAELETRVEELEVELAVWKQAHASGVDMRERESKAHNVQIAALNKQISSMEMFRKLNQPPLILCVINGTHALFNPMRAAQGHNGGRIAAKSLTKGIAEYLANEHTQLFGRLSFWVTVYINKSQVLDMFMTRNLIVSPEQFEAFLAGFRQESPRFLIVDVWNEGVENIKEYLETYIRFPQTLRIFFGGYQELEYSSTFATLDKDQLLGKLVLIQPQDSNELGSYTLPSLQVEDLFVTCPPFSRPPPKLNMNQFGTITNGGLASPESPPRLAVRYLDPTLPLHKQCPPPCNEHYLMTCSKAGACKYAHDYILSPEQLAVLASNAKKAPCNWLKNGLQCPYGNQCCWGHVCPNGSKCFHLSKGKCWFKGEAMHHPLPSSPSSPSS